jgi:hypothetical protein
MVYDGTATIRENSVQTKGVRPMIVQLQKQRSKIVEKLLDARSPDFDKLQSKSMRCLKKADRKDYRIWILVLWLRPN